MSDPDALVTLPMPRRLAARRPRASLAELSDFMDLAIADSRRAALSFAHLAALAEGRPVG